MRARSIFLTFFDLACVQGFWCCEASAQWLATDLHDASHFRTSRVAVVTPNQQFGWADLSISPFNTQAPVWNGTASWTNLAGGNQGAAIYGGGGGQQVGASVAGGGACLWNGTPSSLVSLHAFNASTDAALATDGQEQAGYYIPAPGEPERAVVWRGTAASAVSLHPTGATYSRARAVADGQQGGYVDFTAPPRSAALWSGSAESFLSLHPGAGYNASEIYGMSPGQQVGYAEHAGQSQHAALWRGSAASYVDLNPPGAGLSFLYGTCGSAQVGYANLAGQDVAGIWFGTPESFVSLAAFLPAGYYQSSATCVAEAGGVFYVGGYATNSVSHNDEAFLWVGVPGPGASALAFAAAGTLLRRRR